MDKKIWLVILSFTFCTILRAQGIKIAEVKETVSGTDAFHAPVDDNGYPCGLVKILSLYNDLRFDGEIVGGVVNDNNEYKVYLAKGSKNIIIKRSQVLPVIINFSEYGINEISSKSTYIIKLKELPYKQKNIVNLDVKPHDAIVYVDNYVVDDEEKDGGYQLFLPKGEHIIKAEKKGYRSYAAITKAGSGIQTINIELESLLADVDINCLTSGAHIMIDGEEVGIGAWKGKMPAGSYKVEAYLEDFITISRTIVLEEKGTLSISLPELNRAKGSLDIIMNVNNAEVFIDGTRIYNYNHITDIKTGEHHLDVKAPFGYKNIAKDIKISSGNNTSRIQMDPKDEIYARAFDNDVNAMAQICNKRIESSKFNARDSIERNYWYEKIYDHLDILDKSFFELVCFRDGNDYIEGGLYHYYSKDPNKLVRIIEYVQKNYSNDQYQLEFAILELAKGYNNYRDYESVLKWCTIGLGICCDFTLVGYTDLIAETCNKLGDLDRAIKIFKELLGDDKSSYARGLESVARVYRKRGDSKKADYYENKAIQLDKH